jgi:retron-type reverse transcriptase
VRSALGRRRASLVAREVEASLGRKAVVLSAIYESDFLGFSYGFRAGRSQHNALDALTVAIQNRKVSFVLDADIRGYFDAICHEWLVKFVELSAIVTNRV